MSGIKIQRVLIVFLIYLPLALIGQDIIEKIEIQGNQRIPNETVLYYFGLRSGYTYDSGAAEQGLEALWETGFFADIKVSLNRGERGRVVVLELDEYPLISEFVFKTENKLKQRDIIERLRKSDINMTPYSVFDPENIHYIRFMIQEMLAEKGYNQGKVTSDIIEKGRFEVAVLFRIVEGTRFKIREIIFKGNPKLKRGVLLGAFRINQEHNLFSWLKGNDIFRKAKLDEDLESLKKKYREYGYARIQIGDPVISECTGLTLFGGAQRMKRIIVPVEAGDRYFLGNIEIKNNEIFTSQEIKGLIHLRKGELYNAKRKQQAKELIKELYQKAGFFFVQVFSDEYLDSKNLTADLAFDILEGDKITLKRLKITGNTFTDDKVLRREMELVEQDNFRPDLFFQDLEKLARLGMARIEEYPDIRTDPENPDEIDVHLKIIELYRNEWQLTGGYSGYQGAFVGGSLSAVDVLGAGKKLDLVLEYGERSKNYMIGFLEPYVFDGPLSLRFMVLGRDVVYPGLFQKNGKGIRLGLDAKAGDYWRTGIGYDLEHVDAAAYDIEGGESPSDRTIGIITASLFKDTIDNLFFPSAGMRWLWSFGFAGSELGGDIQYIKPESEGTLFFPAFRNHVFGLHLKYRLIKPIRQSAIPRWERFYLGGEKSLRGYDVYSISPRDIDGRAVGGEQSIVFSFEYILPVFGPVYSILFADAGNAFRYSEKIDLADLYWSSGFEVRWRIPKFRIPVRIIFAYNNRLLEESDSHFALRIAFGASI